MQITMPPAVRHRKIVLLSGSVVLTLCLVTSSTQAQPSAQGVSGHVRMVTLLAQLSEQQPFGVEYERALDRLYDRVEQLPNDVALTQQLAMIQRLAEAQIRAGEPLAAIQHLDEVIHGVRLLRSSQQLRLTMNGRFWLGVVSLRQALLGNCQGASAAVRCTLPIAAAGVHQSQEAGREAMEHFRTVANLTQPEAPEHLAALWLLNVASMLMGDYPQAVPAEHRIDPAHFDGDVAEMRPFEDIGPQLDIDTFSAGGGIAVDDFDGDGWLDLMASSADIGGQLRFFRNSGDGVFVDATDAAGLTGITGGLNLVQADYDGDADLDLLVLRGGWLASGGQHPNSLLRNNGDLTFVDITFEAGLGERHYPTQVGAWSDYDLDGDLDLFIGNEAGDEYNRHSSQLFHNHGDGTFTDVAAAAGVSNRALTKGAAWGDFNGDGYPDLYVSNFKGANRMYRNDGDGKFTDVATALGLDGPHHSYSAWFWDVDNDGALDLLANSYRTPQTAVPDLWYYTADLLGYIHPAEKLVLYKGDGEGGFVDVAAAYGVARVNLATGANFGDLDNDGWLDFYLGTGYPGFEALLPNLMYRSDGGTSFVDVTYAGGFGHLQRGQGVAFADYDNDGDQDIFERIGRTATRRRVRRCAVSKSGLRQQLVDLRPAKPDGEPVRRRRQGHCADRRQRGQPDAAPGCRAER